MFRPLVIATLSLALTASCKDKGNDKPSAEPEPARKSMPAEGSGEATYEPVPAGSALREAPLLEFALYYLPTPKRDPQAAFKALVKKKYSFLSIAEGGTKVKAPSALLITPEIAKFAPPDLESLKYLGRGISPEQEKAVQDSKEATLIGFQLDPAEALKHHKLIIKLMSTLATQTGALLWDESTRHLFTVESWDQRTVDWKEETPQISTLFTIHSYRDGDLLRVVSLGLEKFGLPDLVINDVARSLRGPMSSLINLVAQTLLANKSVSAKGILDVDVNIRPGDWELMPEASGKAQVTLAIGEREEGDADNRLWEIVFPGGPASELQVRHEEFIGELFGAHDEIVQSVHDDELEAASRKGVAELAKMKKEFKTSWPAGDTLLVKAPFTTDDGGNEWMWFELVTWEGDTLKGILQNDPFEVSGLKAGARVEAKFGALFDYIRTDADGRRSGNGTGEILQKRHGK